MNPALTDSATKGHLRGTHRLLAPEETLQRTLPKARAMGITRIANITGLDVVGVPTVAVMRPNARSISVAQGKGLDLAAAKVSGLMESIENYHAEHIQRPLVLASLLEMRTRGRLVDVARLPRVAGSVFHPDTRLLWIEGHEILARTPLWLPFEVVHADFGLPLPTGSGAFMMGDSGVASGNHPFEATVHAVCELIERDAVTLWQYEDERSRHGRRVDLATVEDSACRSVLERFAHAGLRVAAWDVTTDVGLAAFLCTLFERDGSVWRPMLPASGSGCHPCREIALLRALTEAAQVRLTIISGSRDDLGVALYARASDGPSPSEARALEEAARGGKPFDATPTFSSNSFADDIAHVLRCLTRVGVEEVAVVDLSLPEFEIPVVRVVVPGLEGVHEAPGFVPGRRVPRRA